MRLTDYQTLCIDAHGVLIDRDSAILRGLSPLLEQLEDPPPPSRVIADYVEALTSVADEEMDSVSAHCFVHRTLADRWALSPSWQQSIEFASRLGVGSLYEDSPGALQYLRKFYRLRVVTTLDAAEFAAFDQRLGLAAEERLTTGSFIAARARIKAFCADPALLLLCAGPPPQGAAGYRRILRTSSAETIDSKRDFVSLGAFIRAHQNALRSDIV
ncbi:hypothetical protein [Halotalea alkalilenta]|uniref:hypothetical protein n=1 Tax=Halotalea alkalilenta TaxID=376489 RepID=UPI000694C153|nr:hypothetical protein [Halotalea alkalilenta]